MKITVEFLNEKSVCSGGVDWFKKYKGKADAPYVLKALVKDDKWSWANWLIVRIMTRPRYLAYAIFAAEQVIEIYEKKYPGKDKPRKAIEVAKAVLKNDTPENRKAACAAADAAAYAAAVAAYADAYADAAAAASAAYAAAASAGYAAGYAAAVAAYADAAAAGYAAAYAERKEMRKRIFDYGLKLLSRQDGLDTEPHERELLMIDQNPDEMKAVGLCGNIEHVNSRFLCDRCHPIAQALTSLRADKDAEIAKLKEREVKIAKSRDHNLELNFEWSKANAKLEEQIENQFQIIKNLEAERDALKAENEKKTIWVMNVNERIKSLEAENERLTDCLEVDGDVINREIDKNKDSPQSKNGCPFCPPMTQEDGGKV